MTEPQQPEAPDYGDREPARRADDGTWLDPDSGEPVDYPVEELSAGREMTNADLRWFRSRAHMPPLPQQPPAEEDPAEAWHREETARIAELDRQAREAADALGRPSNVDAQDRPHFLKVMGDNEVCGQDGDPWPCPTWRELAQRAADDAAGGGQELTAEQADQVAAQLGVTPQDLLAALRGATS